MPEIKPLTGCELAEELAKHDKPVVVSPPGFLSVPVTGVNVVDGQIVLTTFPMTRAKDSGR